MPAPLAFPAPFNPAGLVTQAALTAVANAIPAPANAAPVAEAVSAAAGSADSRFAMQDHAHPRLSSATIATLDASGAATVTFSRSFSAEPCAVLTAIGTGAAQPTSVEVTSWIKTGANWTGAVIKGYRAQRLPAVLTLLSALLNYDIFGASASGTRVSCVFLMPSG